MDEVDRRLAADRIDLQARRIIRAFDQVDSLSLMATLRALLAASELASRAETASIETIREIGVKAIRAVDAIQSGSIERDVGRHSLREFIDQAFAPVLGLTESDGDLRSDVALVMRDIRLALMGQRKLANARSRWGLAVPDRAPWSEDPEDVLHMVRHSARELCREFRIDAMAVSTAQDVRRCTGLILPADLQGRPMFLAGVAIGADIPVVVSDPMLSVNTFGFPVVQSNAAALDYLRGQLQTVATLVGEDHLICAAEIATELEHIELGDLRRSIERVMDARCARDVEVIALMRENGLEKPFFDIYANGARAGVEPRYAQRINGLRYRVEELRKQLDEARLASESVSNPSDETPEVK